MELKYLVSFLKLSLGGGRVIAHDYLGRAVGVQDGGQCNFVRDYGKESETNHNFRKPNNRLNKKAVFFSADALIALLIILFVVIIAHPISNYAKPDSDIHSDILNSLSTLKISEIDSDYVRSLINDSKIKNPESTLLEQIGEFYVLNPNNPSDAKLLAEAILSDLNMTENIGIWFGEDLIFSNNKTAYENAKDVDIARQVISGIEAGNATKGFSARAFLSSNSRTEYFYFGGYVGDGNVSARIYYDGNITNQSEMELVVNKDFNLYVNDILVGSFVKDVSKSAFEPQKFTFSTSNFQSGENIVKLAGQNLYVAGGFIKIGYLANSPSNAQNGIYHFPGIEGLINLYDGFYVPYNFTSMDIFLHIKSNYTFFLNLANKTVYYGTTNGEQNIAITDAQLRAMGFDYSSMEGKTIPLRLGLENASYSGISKPIDVYSVTDLSGSMVDCVQYIQPYTCRYNCLFGGSKACTVGSPSLCTGNPCGGTCWFPSGHALDCSETKVDLAKEANLGFIDSILNFSINRVGLVGYKDTASSTNYHFLSNNSASLKSEVNSWTASGSTCICCGINKAAADLAANSSNSTFKSMVVMSDGEANVRCAQQGTPNAKSDAILASQQACNNYGIVTHAVGFGDDVDEYTLQQIAILGCNGSYYYSDSSDLADVYRQIANSITTEYAEQTLNASTEVNSRLYPDSYIDFSYQNEPIPYGLVITLESEFGNESGGTFSIPADAKPLITRILSYSGPLWTSKVLVNNNPIFNLNDYSLDYTRLGDPYQITLGDSIVVTGNNTANVTIGVSSTNYTSGSRFDKVVYTIVKNASTFSDVKPFADGCIWHIERVDGSFISARIPNTYLGTDNCYFNSTTPPEQQINDYNDAYKLAVRELLRELDIDNDGRIDVLFSEQDLQISLSEITGIPFAYHTTVQVRRWV